MNIEYIEEENVSSTFVGGLHPTNSMLSRSSRQGDGGKLKAPRKSAIQLDRDSRNKSRQGTPTRLNKVRNSV